MIQTLLGILLGASVANAVDATYLTTKVTAAEASAYLETMAAAQKWQVTAANLPEMQASLKACQQDLGNGEVRYVYDSMDAHPLVQLPESCNHTKYWWQIGNAIEKVRFSKLLKQLNLVEDLDWTEITSLWNQGDFKNYDQGISIPLVYSATPSNNDILGDSGNALVISEGSEAIEGFFAAHEGPKGPSFTPLKSYLAKRADKFSRIVYTVTEAESFRQNSLVLVDQHNQSLYLFMGYSE